MRRRPPISREAAGRRAATLSARRAARGRDDDANHQGCRRRRVSRSRDAAAGRRGDRARFHAGLAPCRVNRGRHCPLCKVHLKTLDGLLEDFEAASVSVVALSGDPAEKAAADIAEHGWRFPVGYGLSVPQMRELALYVSEPRGAQETDRAFPEPGLFLVNPEGKVQIVDISNAPFARPDLAGVLRGAKLIQERGYPMRGPLA